MHRLEPRAPTGLGKAPAQKFAYKDTLLVTQAHLIRCDLRVGIIWHAFGNERKAAQRIGRLLRLNPEQTATVHLLMYQDTIGEHWVAQDPGRLRPRQNQLHRRRKRRLAPNCYN